MGERRKTELLKYSVLTYILVIGLAIVFSFIGFQVLNEKPRPPMSREARETYEDFMIEQHGFVPWPSMPTILVVLILVVAWALTCLPFLFALKAEFKKDILKRCLDCSTEFFEKKWLERCPRCGGKAKRVTRHLH